MPVGSQADFGTRTSICRRAWSSETCGAAPGAAVPVAACVISATSPEPSGWTVRNWSAGARTLAPCGNGNASPGVPPMATEIATSDGSLSVLRVKRNAVASASGLTRSSTRSAALFAYAGSVG